jgi:hypothetical protein
MATYAEIKAGTPCTIPSQGNREATYLDDDLLRVTASGGVPGPSRDAWIECGPFRFRSADLRLINSNL